jgi:hypothetical protein
MPNNPDAIDVKNQTIHNFFETAVVQDFSRDYLFRVTEINFDGFPGEGLNLNDRDLLYVRTAKLPARQIVNQTAKYAGQTFNIPGSVEYPGSEGYEMEFYCPELSRVREILMNESHRTFGNYYGIAGSGNGGGSIANQNSTITMVQLNKGLQAINTYQLIGCSIRNVGEVAYNIADGNGAVMTFNVSIAYHFFKRFSVVAPIDNS